MKSPNLSLALIFLFLNTTISLLSAQTDSIQQVINQQIWQAFQESYQAYDYQKFNDLHSDQMIRINSKEIRTAAVYKQKNKDWFVRAKAEGYQQRIEFRFEKRIATGDRAYETGYYKIDAQKPDGTSSTHFARFHVALQKEAGIWKIIEDWDSNKINGQKVNANHFYQSENIDDSATGISTIEFVKIQNNHQEECIFYFENNWKVLRELAIEKGYIQSFRLLINETMEEEYDILLITEYRDQEQFDQREEHFRELIEAQKEGLQLLNDLQAEAFRKSVRKMTVKSQG